MALEAVGSSPIIHPTDMKKRLNAFFSYLPLLGCSQAVRHQTLTLAFRWSESIQPNQNKTAGRETGSFILVPPVDGLFAGFTRLTYGENPDGSLTHAPTHEGRLAASLSA